MPAAALSRREIARATHAVVMGRRTASGLDEVSPDHYTHLSVRGQLAKQLYRALRDGRYRPYGAKRGFSYRPGKSPRQHAILTVLDAIVQRAVTSGLDDIWPKLPPSIIGGRPGTVPQVVVTEFFKLISERDGLLLRFDVMRAFASASRERALRILEDSTDRPELLTIFRSWAERQGNRFPGLIEGQPLGPLMLAVLLAPMMRELKQIGLTVLYLDDGLVVVDDEREMRAALDIIDTHLRELDLELHPDKTVICRLNSNRTTPSAWQFLGYQMRRSRPIPTRSKCNDLVSRLTKEAHKGANAKVIGRIIAGWAGYYSVPGAEDVLRDTDRRISAWVGHLGPLPRLERLIGTRASSRPRGLRARGSRSSWAKQESHWAGSGESLIDLQLVGQNQTEGYQIYSLRDYLTKPPGNAQGDVAVASTEGGDSALLGAVPLIEASGGQR